MDLTVEEGRALVEIKNTANYEMNFSEEEITERFFRETRRAPAKVPDWAGYCSKLHPILRWGL